METSTCNFNVCFKKLQEGLSFYCLKMWIATAEYQKTISRSDEINKTGEFDTEIGFAIEEFGFVLKF